MCYYIKYVFINKNKLKMIVVLYFQGNSKLCFNNFYEFIFLNILLFIIL